MIKHLNRWHQKRSFRLMPTKPELKKITGFDKNIYYDPNSMDLYESDSELTAEGMGKNEAPFFHGKINLLLLQLTSACNLGCKYCFVGKDEGARDRKDLSLEKIKEKVQEIFPYFINVDLSFFGGEPLLKWDIIYDTVEWLKENNANAKLHTTTNATLLNTEIAQYLTENNFTYIISLEGPENIHNESRPFRVDGINSFQKTTAGLENLKAAMLRLPPQRRKYPTLRSTFTANAPIALVERLDFLNNLMWAGFAKHVSVEPVWLAKDSPMSFEQYNNEELHGIFDREYADAARWYVEKIKEKKRPHFHHFDNFIKRLLEHQFSPSECGAGIGYVTLGPSGVIHACHREFTGCTELGVNCIDAKVQCKWVDNRYYARNGCKKCYLRNVCGGGCRINSIIAGNDLKTPSHVECFFRKIWFKCAIFILSEMTEDEKRWWIRG